MLITVFLSSLVLVFARQTQLAVTIAKQQMSQAQARWIADGVVQGVLADLQLSIDSSVVPSLDFVEPNAGQVGQGLYWILYNDTTGNEVYATKTFGLQDMCGKLNLNMSTLQLINRQVLPLLPQMDSDLASVIYDWRDGDDEPGVMVAENANLSGGGSGAEADYYLSQRMPYPAKNGEFTTVYELMLLRGFDDAILLGEDANQNGLLDDNENDGNASPPEDNANGRLDRGLLDYVSVYGREPNITMAGDERIDVNDNASQPDLLAFFQDVLGEENAGRIAAQIAQESSDVIFSSVLDIKRRLGPQLSDENFEVIEPRLTTADQDTLTGLINVLSASEEVIAAVTGDEDMARDIVNARPQDGSTSLLWLLDAVDDEEEAARVAGLFTTRSFQFSADIVALSGDGRGFVRLLAVFETLSDNGQEIEAPRVVQIQDLTHLGWPLDPEIRQELRQGVSAEAVATKYGSRIQ